ncbi:MAG: hypothetical protein WDO73_06445 [Ignavibacteriota bacterium]
MRLSGERAFPAGVHASTHRRGHDSREIDRQVKQSVRTSVSIYEVFDEVIAQLAPTHILTQIQCEVCAVSLRDVEQALARAFPGEPAIVPPAARFARSNLGGHPPRGAPRSISWNAARALSPTWNAAWPLSLLLRR